MEKFEEALSQAAAYGSGSLAPIELRSYRYLVAISDDYLPHMDDREADGVVYKHVNVAVAALRPSLTRLRRSVYFAVQSETAHGGYLCPVG